MWKKLCLVFKFCYCSTTCWASPFPSGILIKKGDIEEEPVITIGPTTANDPVIPADPVYGKGFTIFEEAGKLNAKDSLTDGEPLDPNWLTVNTSYPVWKGTTEVICKNL